MFVHKSSRLWMKLSMYGWKAQSSLPPSLASKQEPNPTTSLGYDPHLFYRTSLWCTLIVLLTMYSIVLQLKTTPNLKGTHYVPMVAT